MRDVDPLVLKALIRLVAVALVYLGVELRYPLRRQPLLGVDPLLELVVERAVQYAGDEVEEQVRQRPVRVRAEDLPVPVRGHELHADGLHLAYLVVRDAEDEVARHAVEVQEVAELVEGVRVVV